MAFVKRKDSSWGIGDFMEEIFDKNNLPFKMGKVEFPLVNLCITDNNYIIEAACPGSRKEEFNIDFEGNKIILTYEKTKVEEGLEEKVDYKVREFGYKLYRKSFDLPQDIKKDSVSAKFENGLLKIYIPRVEVMVEDKMKIDIE